MPNLNSRKKIYTIGEHTDIISSNNPNGDVGVSALESQTGFFIFSDFSYELWFKDQNGIWGSYKSFPNGGGNTFAWGTNQAFYLKTAEASGNIKVFRRDGPILIDSTPDDGNDEIDALIVEDATSLSLLDRTGQQISSISVGSSNHATLANLEWNVSGHRGVPFSIVMFDENGVTQEIAPPAEGSRTDKVLKWTSNTEIGWVSQ